jgi:hypothetical protein
MFPSAKSFVETLILAFAGPALGSKYFLR